MKKSLLSLSVLILITVIGALFLLPYGLGFVAQNKYSQILDTFAKSNTIQLSLVNYQRGWFSSEATVKVVLPGVPKLAALLIQQHIEHGPIFSITAANHQKRLMLGQTLISSQVKTPFGIVDIVSWISLQGAFSGTLHIPTLYHQTAQQGHSYAATLTGISGDFQLPADLKKIAAHLQIPKAVIKIDHFEQQIDQTDIVYQLKKSDSGLFLGQRRLAIRAVALNFPIYPFKLQLQGLKAEADGSEQNHKLQSEINIALQQVLFNNAAYGPQQLLLAINQLDVPSFLALSKELNSWKTQPELDDQAYARYQQLLVNLLSHGLQIQVKRLALVTPLGAPQLVGSITFPAQSANDVMTVFTAADAQFNLQIPATFLMRLLEKINGAMMQHVATTMAAATTPIAAPAAPAIIPTQLAQQQVTEWVNKKWLVPKDNGYQISVLRQNRQLTINGQPLDITQ
jgi:uncharacterized protein YdgA (DUF945 family)